MIKILSILFLTLAFTPDALATILHPGSMSVETAWNRMGSTTISTFSNGIKAIAFTVLYGWGGWFLVGLYQQFATGKLKATDVSMPLLRFVVLVTFASYLFTR